MPTEKVEPSGNKGVTREHQPQASPSAEPQLSSITDKTRKRHPHTRLRNDPTLKQS